ncbi:MAG: haloalkane dehalogenase [Myxococcota bacterium]
MILLPAVDIKRDLLPAALLLATTTGTLSACSDDASTTETPRACDAEPELRTTPDGVEFVRTPDTCFDDLPDWPYEPHYVELDGLRQAYVDEGPADGPVVLLLHGQPSWSYLYRTMIPVLADAGFRVIAMDHLGMGRSDKPTDISSYSYVGHADRLTSFIEALDLRDINLFVQDWGSLIGLRVAGLHADRFARIAVGNGTLPNIPDGITPYPPVEDPDVEDDLPSPFVGTPDQQLPYYDGCEPLREADPNFFGDWMTYAMKGSSFRPSEVLEALTWFPVPPEQEAAYDAPFPSRIYLAGARTFPSLVNELPGANVEAWAGLTSFERPFLTIWADNDEGNLGRCETQQQLIMSVPGAAGLPHARLPEASHFLQDDQGVEIAERLVPFFGDEIEPIAPFGAGDRYCEILLVHLNDGDVEAEVWGTQNLNTCPAETWEAIDPDAIQMETGALAVTMNGPRVWLAPISEASGMDISDRQRFGDLEMRRLATVALEPSDLEMERGPYIEATVMRTTTYRFETGTEVYELTAPDGSVYVMQSMSQIVDPDLTVDQLPDLGQALTLPDGWSYAARTVEEPLEVASEGAATVIEDDLNNVYQRR